MGKRVEENVDYLSDKNRPQGSRKLVFDRLKQSSKDRFSDQSQQGCHQEPRTDKPTPSSQNAHHNFERSHERKVCENKNIHQ